MAWTQEEAISLCRDIERIAPEFGCHVALTGGCLYKSGARKDLDLLFYRIRSVESIDIAGLFTALRDMLHIRRVTDAEVWCIKARYEGKGIDCFFPECEGGDYTPGDDTSKGNTSPATTNDSPLEF